MRQWSIILHGPLGIVSSIETTESQFVIGSEESSDVWKIEGEGIAPRHAWVWIAQQCMQVEDLAGGPSSNA